MYSAVHLNVLLSTELGLHPQTFTPFHQRTVWGAYFPVTHHGNIIQDTLWHAVSHNLGKDKAPGSIHVSLSPPKSEWSHAYRCHMIDTLEQTKSTSVGSSSPMYSIIFLLIQGRTRRSINVWKKDKRWRRRFGLRSGFNVCYYIWMIYSMWLRKSRGRGESTVFSCDRDNTFSLLSSPCRP